MRKIEYTTEIIEEYQKIFSRSMKTKDKLWKKWRGEIIDYDPEALPVFPEEFKAVLTASVEDLVAMFTYYYDHRNDIIIKDSRAILRKIFNYGNWQPRIANFFMQHAEELEVHTCFYCETSYINKYEGNDSKKRNHFDLDHFLPKTLCPIVGLSIRNFVPSCAVCNEKLKRKKIPGICNAEDSIMSQKDKIVKLCPSSDRYSFDSDVNILIEPLKKEDFTRTLRLQDHAEKYTIQFEGSDTYQHEINMFHLRERYGYHKLEALRLYDLLNDYPPELVHKISELIPDKDADEVMEDLFGLSFSHNRHRCFDKMKQDIAKMFKR